MKILIISSDPIPHTGGKSTHILNLKKGLEHKGHEVLVFSPSSISKYLFWLIVSIPIRAVKLFNKESVPYFYKSARMFLMSFILKWIKKYNAVDVINCQDTFAVLTAQRVFKNIPVILTMHTYIAVEITFDKSDIKQNTKRYEQLEKLETNIINSVQGIVCVDSRIKEHIKSYFKGKNICMIPNFTDTDKFVPINEQEKSILKGKYKLDKFDNIILSTRRLVEKNGVIYAVQAIKHLDLKFNACLVLTGDGPQKEKILHYVKENNIEDKVVFLGNVPNEEIVELYNLSDIVVIPSVTVRGLQEATSLSAIEAMSCGVPVVASNIGGLKELISNGETGFLVEEKNALAIAEQCAKLLEDEGLRKSIGKNARNFITKYNSHIEAASKYIKIYQES
ncbi:glycosyltransferase family 4 protein, partial [Peptococcaceae bacterium]|nr:glycosyltransferase family 4 protein [Peptococcaceae bacterium]